MLEYVTILVQVVCIARLRMHTDLLAVLNQIIDVLLTGWRAESEKFIHTLTFHNGLISAVRQEGNHAPKPLIVRSQREIAVGNIAGCPRRRAVRESDGPAHIRRHLA